MPDFKAFYYQEPMSSRLKTRVMEILPVKAIAGARDAAAENASSATYLLELEDTCFYPEGGGQPGDRGVIKVPGAAEYAVLDTQELGEKIYHYIAADSKPALEPGQEVSAEIDFARRFKFMQHHSGEHVFSGVVASLYGCSNIGFHIGEDFMTIDYDRPLSAEQIKRAEAKANEEVWRCRPIRQLFPTSEEAAALDYRSKKDVGPNIRLIEVEEVDLCTCCGTHLSNTGQIGLIKSIGFEPHRGGVRIDMVCGQKAYEYALMLEEAAKKAGSVFSVPPPELPAAALAEREKGEALKRKIKKMRLESLALLLKNPFNLAAEGAEGREVSKSKSSEGLKATEPAESGEAAKPPISEQKGLKDRLAALMSEGDLYLGDPEEPALPALFRGLGESDAELLSDAKEVRDLAKAAAEMAGGSVVVFAATGAGREASGKKESRKMEAGKKESAKKESEKKSESASLKASLALSFAAASPRDSSAEEKAKPGAFLALLRDLPGFAGGGGKGFVSGKVELSPRDLAELFLGGSEES